MGNRVKPPEGQRCDHPDHGLLTPHLELKRVYSLPETRADRRFCYEWWCVFCRSDDTDDFWDWPTDEHGRFAKAAYCPSIPGID